MSQTTGVCKRDTIMSIRAEWREETGEDPGKVGAEILLDRMADAFVHKWEGGGPEYAVRQDRRTAEYLCRVWKGHEGNLLRRIVRRVYG